MYNKDFFKGMGMGIGVGAAISMAFVPVRNHRKNDVKSGVGKVIKTIDIIEGVTEAVGL